MVTMATKKKHPVLNNVVDFFRPNPERWPSNVLKEQVRSLQDTVAQQQKTLTALTLTSPVALSTATGAYNTPQAKPKEIFQAIAPDTKLSKSLDRYTQNMTSIDARKAVQKEVGQGNLAVNMGNDKNRDFRVVSEESLKRDYDMRAYDPKADAKNPDVKRIFVLDPLTTEWKAISLTKKVDVTLSTEAMPELRGLPTQGQPTQQAQQQPQSTQQTQPVKTQTSQQGRISGQGVKFLSPESNVVNNDVQNYIQDQIEKQENYVPQNDPRNYAPLLTAAVSDIRKAARPDVHIYKGNDGNYHGFHQDKRTKEISEVKLGLRSSGNEGWRLTADIPKHTKNGIEVEQREIDPIYKSGIVEMPSKVQNSAQNFDLGKVVESVSNRPETPKVDAPNNIVQLAPKPLRLEPVA
jgi:hypothetical protein